jgi:hypothetical protein
MEKQGGIYARYSPGRDRERIIKMRDNVTEIQEATVTLTVEQLEQIIRKVVREELMEFTTLDLFDLDKTSPLHEDMEDILERKSLIN